MVFTLNQENEGLPASLSLPNFFLHSENTAEHRKDPLHCAALPSCQQLPSGTATYHSKIAQLLMPTKAERIGKTMSHYTEVKKDAEGSDKTKNSSGTAYGV